MIDKQVEAITKFMPKLISLVAAIIVATLIFQLVAADLNIEGFGRAVLTAIAASLLTVVVMSSLDAGS